MSGNNSDSESSLSDWELVQQGDLQDQDQEPARDSTDNEGSSSGSEFVHLDHTAVSYHHRQSQDRELVEIGADDLKDVSHETLEATSSHIDEDDLKKQLEQGGVKASPSVSFIKEDSEALGDENDEVPEEDREATIVSPQLEESAGAILNQTSDLLMSSADPLTIEDNVKQGPQLLIGAESSLEEASAAETVAVTVADAETEEEADDEKDNGSEHSEPSEPELLDLSDAKSTDSTESEVEILVASCSTDHESSECDTADSALLAETSLTEDKASAPIPESDLNVSSIQSLEASPPISLEDSQDEPGASFMAGAPHQYLQSLIQHGTKAPKIGGGDDSDAESDTEADHGAVGGQEIEEDGIQVLAAGKRKPGLKRGDTESSDDDNGQVRKDSSGERDRMNASGSSVSSRFSFIHRDRRSDDESLPESDISLIDDSDLSNQDQLLDQVSLFDPVRIRQYRHKPNTNVNTILSLVMGAVLALGIGIGIGHAFGSSGELLFKRHRDANFVRHGETDQVRNLKETLNTCAGKRDDMEASIYEYQKGKLSVILDQLQKRVGLLEKENIYLVLDVKKRTKRMKEVREENKNMKSRVEDMHDNLNRLTKSMVDMKSQKSFLEGRNMDERKANIELQKNLTDFKLHLDQLSDEKRMQEIEKNTEISDLQGRVIDLGSELEDVKMQKQQLMQSHETFAVQLNDAKNNLDELSRGKEETEHHSSSLLKELKTRLNSLLVENMDLRAEVARLRYRQHPANPDQTAQFKEKVNMLSMENEELQSAVSKSRYTKGPPQDKSSAEKLQEQNRQLEKKLKDLSDSLEQEQSRSDMWQTMFISEKAKNNSTNDKEEKKFMDCMQIVFSHINVTEFTIFFNSSNSKNLTKVFMEKVSFIINSTKNMNFSDFVNKKWGAFYNFSQSAEFKDAFRYAENGYDNLQDILVMKWKQFQNYTNSENFQKHVNQTKDIISQMKETVDKTISKVQNFSNSDHVKEYINKTKETMSKLSFQIKETWSRLKNISSGLYKSNEPKVRKVQDDVASTLFEFGKTIKDRFGKFGSDFHDRYKKGKKHKCRGSSCSGHEKKQETKENVFHEEKRDKTGNGFEGDFNDDINCKKVVKKFKGLRVTVENLTKKRWYRFDNSDREEILEDFNEFNDRYLLIGKGLSCLVGDHDVAWLNCQISWWRASLSENLNEQLCRSCEKSLAGWQAKVSRKYLKEMKKKHKQGKVKVVLMSEQKQTTETSSAEKVKNADDNSTIPEVPAKDKKKDTKSAKEKANWFLKRAEDREDHRHSPKWYFSRMEDREDGRHDTKWYFNRADDRTHRHKKSTRDEEPGTFGCTKRRGDSGVFIQPCSHDKTIPEDEPERDPHDKVFFEEAAEGFYKDLDDPNIWHGY